MRSLLLFLFLFSILCADELTTDPPIIWNTHCLECIPPETCVPYVDGIVVDLMNPTYEHGSLYTEEGGVLVAPGIRIQAQKILCVKNFETDPAVFAISCEGNILVDYKKWVLAGDSLYYDFITHTGYLICGKTAVPPWYLGGEKILLLNDGNFEILNGYLSTSEGVTKDLILHSPHILVTPSQVITASNLNVKVKQVPVLWFPSFTYDLKNIGRSPFATKVGWGGFKGSYVSLLYRFLSWGEFQGVARIDAFFTRGIGGGIETIYDPKWRATQFYTRNYFAHDLAIFDRERRNRYRFQGTYFDCLYGVTIDGMYDFVSDGEMAADYQAKDFELNTAGRTQLKLRHLDEGWLANLFARVRVNDFQSVNQELPSFQMHIHPFDVGETGVIFENTFKTSFLNYVFSDEVPGKDFHAGRFSVYPRLYRPFALSPALTLTPEAGFIGIAYTNSPGGTSAGQALGELGLKAESVFSKVTPCWKHVVEPYAHYRFLTHPRVSTDHHFIFSINDGYDRLNILRFGVRNALFIKSPIGMLRPIWLDIWGNAFFATQAVGQVVPKGYLTIEFDPHARVFVVIDTAWNFEKKRLDFYNTRIEWTLSESVACAIEYRHRSSFDWRKADFYNFILESVRPIDILENSSLSDRRDIILFRTFFRPNPNYTLRFDWRNGWNRKKQRAFHEYQIELTTRLFEHWRFACTVERRTNEYRYSVFLKLDPGPPPKSKACRCY